MSLKEALENLDEKNRTFEIDEILGIMRADDTIRIQLDDGGENAVQVKISMEQAKSLLNNLRGTIE